MMLSWNCLIMTSQPPSLFWQLPSLVEESHLFVGQKYVCLTTKSTLMQLQVMVNKHLCLVTLNPLFFSGHVPPELCLLRKKKTFLLVNPIWSSSQVSWTHLQFHPNSVGQAQRARLLSKHASDSCSYGTYALALRCKKKHGAFHIRSNLCFLLEVDWTIRKKTRYFNRL